MALQNLSRHLAAGDRHQEARAAAEEAVSIWRALARKYLGRYQEIYNRTLAQLRRDLDVQGQEADSLQLYLDDDGPD
jgi:hypothetical protein